MAFVACGSSGGGDGGDVTNSNNGRKAIITTKNGYTLVIKSDGTLWDWGRNDFGQLGDGATSGGSITPVQIFLETGD